MPNPQPNARDIDKVFNSKVAPQLLSFERERLAALGDKRRRWRKGGMIGAVIVGAILAFCMVMDYPKAIAIPFAVVALIGVWIWASLATGDYEARLRDTLMAAVCDYIGDMTYRHSKITGFDLKAFKDTHLVPSSSTSSLEDLVEGTYRNSRFSLVEAKLSRTTRDEDSSSSETVFDGLLLAISVPQAIEGTILIARDYGSWMNSARGWFRDGVRVEIPHAAFEDKYEVYASNERLALDVVTPAFVGNFLKLSRVIGSDKLRAAFIGETFLMSADGVDDLLDDFSAKTPTAELNTVFKKVVEETQLIHRIIDQLHEPGKAAQDASLGDGV